jgi:KDO2-lipid IV(A) lauroyltransferase
MTPPAIAAGFIPDGWERLDEALQHGTGAIMAMPHLGGWEWAGFWVTQVRQRPVTAVVERLEPPALFDWFVELRQALGFEIVALGPEAGAATARALKANHTLALLCDRDLAGTGPEVEFFGERTTLPGGPATLALRTGAALLPTAIYFDGPHSRRSLVLPPIDTTRQGKFRQDVQRVTQELAQALEVLIRRAPEQWHLLQPNWPSDRAN